MRPLLVVTLLLASACSNEPPVFDRGNAQVQAHYDHRTGKLTSITYDANRNGRIDTWTWMDGPIVVRVEIDRDEDGKIDRWEYYRPDNTLDKVAWSRLGNGRPDAWAYQDATGKVARVEYAALPSPSPGAPTPSGAEHAAVPPVIVRTEYFTDGVLARAEEDTNGDGRIDKWETWVKGAITEVRFDTTGAGVPDRRLVYLPGGDVRSERLSNAGPGRGGAGSVAGRPSPTSERQMRGRAR